MKELIAAGNHFFGGELAALDDCIESLLASEFPAVANLGRHLLAGSGKRFRPLLTLLFHRLMGADQPQRAAVELGAVIEMIHLATLAHDDVIDKAEMRRHRPSLWKSAGNRSAVLEGDFIFSRAFRLLNPHPEKIRLIVIKAVEEVLQGELLQESLRLKLPEEVQYYQVISGKTAALISAACAVGALAGNPELEESQLESVERAGLLMGEAFQMMDDLLDVFGDESLGKPRWTDQRGGWLTWPYIRLLKKTSSADLLELLFSPTLSDDERRGLLERMEHLGIRGELMSLAQSRIQEMKSLLSWIPGSQLKDLLFESSDLVLQRTS